jgi:hypothetical protein
MISHACWKELGLLVLGGTSEAIHWYMRSPLMFCRIWFVQMAGLFARTKYYAVWRLAEVRFFD